MINFDANACYGTLPEVLAAVRAWTGDALNPSSIHGGGQAARRVLEEARDALRELVAAPKEARLVFTSGATEANNQALLAARMHGRPGRAICSRVEHPSVLAAFERLSTLGWKVSFVDPTSAAFAAELSPETDLVSCMLANNETGEIFPVAELRTLVRRLAPRALLHCDAVQAAGRVPLDMRALGVDFLTLSAHKLGGLCGCGALIAAPGAAAGALLLGGPQESRLRAGTENVLGVLALDIAARTALREQPRRFERMREVRDLIEAAIEDAAPDAEIIGRGTDRLPNTCCVRIPGVRADDLVVALDLEGVGISSGAACASGKPEPSHVLLARGMPAAAARESVRISVRGEYAPGEVEGAIDRVARVVRRMRAARVAA